MHMIQDFVLGASQTCTYLHLGANKGCMYGRVHELIAEQVHE